MLHWFDLVMPKVLYFSFAALSFKTIMGFHWPWETCQCCGKKYRDHKQGGTQ